MVNVKSLKKFILEKYPIHSQKIDLQQFKRELKQYFHLKELEIEDDDLLDFLGFMGYMNVELHQAALITDNEELSEVDEDDNELSLDSFFENEYDSKELLMKSGSYKDNRALFEEYRETNNDPLLTEKIIKVNQNLVKKIAAKYVGIARGFTYEDLINEGNLGLIKAISKYDVSLDYEFSTYATHWIRQSITRAIADKSNIVRIPVHTIEKINKVNKIERELEITKPNHTIDEVCMMAEITKERYLYLKEVEYKFIHDSSLNSFVKAEGSDEELIDFIPTIDADYMAEKFSIEEIVVSNAMKEVIEDVLNELKDREKEILQYRFGFIDGKEYTLEAVGKKFNVTRERIRQIEAKTLKRLRYNIGILELID